MTKLFIPTDRVGIGSYQSSIGAVARTVNRLLAAGAEVDWHLNGLRVVSANWPEGHDYQCGYATDDQPQWRALLEEAGLVYDVTEQLPLAALRPRLARIAFYHGSGTVPEFSAPLENVLQQGGFCYEQLSDAEIRGGRLREFDIFLVPGSPDAGECYYRGLGDLGYDNIRAFIAEQGHYLGICGGAYFPLTSYSRKNPYWLNIVAATEQEDLDYWHTGSGFVRCRLDADTHPVFAGVAAGRTTSLNLVYWEGPAIHPVGDQIRTLARFETLLANGYPALNPYWDMQDNAMPDQAVHAYYNPLSQQTFDRLLKGETAFAEAEYYGHKLLLYSCHPEMGNLGTGPREDSQNFLLVYNGLLYLSAQ